MSAEFTRGITVLSDTGYRLAPGGVSADLLNRPDPPLPEGTVTAAVKVHAEGKTYVWATAPANAGVLVEWALAWSLRVWSYIDEEEFRRHAALMRLTEPEIEAALASIRIHDDCYFRRPGRLELTPEKVRARDEGH
jgi:hypothetical protein